MAKSNSETERAFFEAIAQGNVKSVRKQVIDCRELLQSYDYQCFGATPLTRVCFSDDRPMLTTLLELGADINRRSDWNMGPWSPLHCAVSGGNTDLAEFLLGQGAELDAHGAAGTGRLSDLKELLDKNPQRVHERGGDGCQPLHFAYTVDIAKLLLERGADIDARCVDHYSTPVQYLANSQPKVARFLFAQGAEPDIFSAILANDRELVDKLIADNPEVLQQRIGQETFPPGPDHDVHNIMTFTIGGGCTPMHAAATANLPEMVRLLMAAGLSIDARGGYDESTPLHMAAWCNHLPMAKMLVETGADLNARSGKLHDNTPAGWAIVGGSADVFCYLVDQGADILDSFSNDAAAGVRGEFDQHQRVDAAARLEIQARIERLATDF